MIDVQNLRKTFGSFVAVSNISFQLKRGEVLGFLGPNGAGKSTAMKMITGFLTPTDGQVSICGHDVTDEPIKVKAALGYLPEGAPTYGDMTPNSFLEFIAEIRGYKGEEKQKRVQQAVATTNLESVLHKPIETLSKGFKRRVGLAQAILHDPDVLILDEPTDGLDPNQKHEVRALLQSMAKDKAIIISTHILEEVEAVCTRAMIISRGELLFDGTPQELEAQSKVRNAVSLVLESGDTKEVSRKLEQLNQVASVQTQKRDDTVKYTIIPKDGKSIVKDLAHLCRSENWTVDEMHVEPVKLDEVFRSITTSESQEVRT
ncbi:MAG: ABC transporter ATP-binding protein [Gammaproteobacteria bacterium]|nr:ABC transporter ATP-binding protein [Gammaproteobacteria bacterium]MDH5802968.1 ABC transporter ATP-binding protein [Gammaproteobacteria bacterium]